MASQRIPLSLTEHYAPSWKTWEGVREFVQNWYDGTLSCSAGAATSGSISGRIAVKRDEDSHKYYAHVHPTEGQGSAVLGTVMYCEKTCCLSLVNFQTSLQRKVLLLGYSKKANHHDVIGQFGEGLKVGALALLRSGREVVMETSFDCWRFRLDDDPVFGEKVLTVFVSGRGADESQCSIDEVIPPCPVQLNDGDTCVQIWPLSKKEWIVMAKKFLFLEPPKDYVHTELGTLLLDGEHQGQLFVKQVWVSDQRSDGLSAGVNFKSLRIDRDRRAVVHQSDINHQVSSMWVRALQRRPDLVPRYFEMLQQSTACDVRHASFYCDQPAMAALLAAEFFRINGENAFPVLNTMASGKLQQLSSQIADKIVLCNQALMDILLKSGRVQSLEEVLSSINTKKILPFSSLSSEQLSLVRHSVELARLALPEMAVSKIDLCEGDDNNVTYLCSGRWLVPVWMLSRDVIHTKSVCHQQTSSSNCRCPLAFLCMRLLASHCVAKQIAGDSIQHLIVASLVQQVCKQEPPFCDSLHKSLQLPNAESDAMCSVLKKREEELQLMVENLQHQVTKMEQEYQLDLRDLQEKVASLEQQLTKDEVKFVDMEQALVEGYKKQRDKAHGQHEAMLRKAQKKYDKLYSETLSKSAELQHHKEQLSSLREQMSELDDKHERRMQGLKSKSEWYLKRLADRAMKLVEVNSAHGSIPRDSEISRLLQQMMKEFEDDQKKDVCVVCASSAKNCVILPCRHQHTCMDCAVLLSKCAVCRIDIQQRLQVYN